MSADDVLKDQNEPPGIPLCPDYTCVHRLLEAAQHESPLSIAVEFQGQCLTYAQLHARANQLARALQKRGVGREVLVGVCMHRSLEMVVALLAILKSGGAYVPLDPSFGNTRIQYILDEARVRVLLTQESLRTFVSATSAEILCIDSSWKSIADESDAPVATDVQPDNLAYVIYTSGSTGKPKGVQLEHRSLANFLCSMREQPGLAPRDALVAVTTISFDIAALEIFLPLLVGGRLILASAEATVDPRALQRLLTTSHATVMQATPTTWHLLFESGWTGDRNLKVLVGGEAVSPQLARKLANSCGEVWNMYGPTETTVWSSLYRVQGRDQSNVPIGKAIANTSLYILGANREPLPLGSEGELYIGGDGLARGYLQKPELTAEKFVPDPFSRKPGGRMYRTGDLARYREDGNVVFLGRLDHQVKIRGFRIELGELEAVLEQHPNVQKAVTIARDRDSSSKYLAAYFLAKPGATVSPAELRDHLRKQLPDYMIPAVFLTMQQFPLTPNGKIDRKALPAPKADDFVSDHEYVAPRDAVEKTLAKLWQEVLEIPRVGAKDNFFHLGGKSLMAARLFTKIIHKFGKELPLTTLIHAPTLELLANELRTTVRKGNYATLVPMRNGGSRPPFFCVHGGAGSTLFMHRLAAKMDSEQPFYGIEPEGLDGRRFQRTTIEQIAAYYIAEIRKVQPKGPYYLGGYCFGGIVAFEMAQQLRRQGEDAALVALFTAALRYHRLESAPAPPPEPNPQTKPARQKLATLMKSPLRVLYRKSAVFVEHQTSKLEPLIHSILFALHMKIPPSMRTRYVWRTLINAEQNYVPQPYSGTLVMFHGSDYAHDTNLGWDGLAEQFEHHVIGNSSHDSRRDLMNEPFVGRTAQELGDCIAAAAPRESMLSTSAT